ncbi:MAG: Crp/Fnr family transcriptional regulator, partial [Bacteroidota bacterium]
DEDNLSVDLNSFNNQIPSAEYVQAIVPTQLYVFTHNDLKQLSKTIVVWDRIINQLVNKALLEKVNRISPMLAEEAKTRYSAFSTRFPNLLHRIPLHYLASYIGVTKHTLSRIRRELAEQNSSNNKI